MSQMPYGYPQGQPYYPPQPQQGYPAPMQQPGYGQMPPQQFPQQAPQAPAAPVATGSLSDFYNQPSSSGGPAISWKGKADGTAYAGIISGKAIVEQDIDFDTKQPKFQRDGVTPKWVMKLPLKQVQTNHPGPAEFPDGEAVFYVRGVAKDELARAMAEANCSGEPREGGSFQVTLTHRKPNRQGSPTNMFAIQYVPPGGVPHRDEPAATPVQQEAPAAPAPAGLPPVQQQEAQAPQGLPPLGQPPQQQAPAGLLPLGGQQQAAPPPQWAQPAQAQAPAAPPQVQQALPPEPPAGLAPEAQALLQQLGAGQQQVQG